MLFSGQSALGPFIAHSASYSVGALLLLLACKGLAYGMSLSSFRGGPTFPALFLGAAGGIALSHLPGLPLVAGVAMGIGAMSVVMLRLPLTSVLLASLLLAVGRPGRHAAGHRGRRGGLRALGAAGPGTRQVRRPGSVSARLPRASARRRQPPLASRRRRPRQASPAY